MRIGISGGGSTVDRIVQHAVEAEGAGFHSVWYASAVAGDPLVAIALAGRATTTIELGTAVLQTYPCHPLLMANRAAATSAAVGGPRFTLGIGPSHDPLIHGVYGLPYDRPGRHTEEYTRILAPALRGEEVDFRGTVLEAHSSGRVVRPDHRVPLLLGALAPRMLRVAGELADGTITWMANARAVEEHVAPLIRAAAGSDDPRLVVGIPVAVHDDVAEARTVAAAQFGFYGGLPNYRRILDAGHADGPEDVAVVGDEAAVTAALQRIVDAGATDIWAAPFPVGDRATSRERTRALLASLAGA